MTPLDDSMKGTYFAGGGPTAYALMYRWTNF